MSDTSYEYRKLCDFIIGDILRHNDKDRKIVQIKRESVYVGLTWIDHGVPQQLTGSEWETYLATKREEGGQG